MYILASEFFKKDDKYYLKLEIRVACREFIAFKYVVRNFKKLIFKTIFFCTQYSFIFVLAGRGY